jgi:hypothetical protein
MAAGIVMAPRVPTAAETALLRAVDLGVLAVTAAGAVATGIAALAGSSPVAAGIAAGSVLATVFAWVTRVAMVRASAGPPEALGVWILVSYAVKGVLVLVGLTLGAKDGDLSRTAYGLTLVIGIVVSVGLQALLFRPRSTPSVSPVATPLASAYDDDAAVAEARANHAVNTTGTVRNNGAAAGKVPSQ